jgi:Putative zinc-finger
MDHNEAIRLQSAVKYVLGELSQAQRDEYEEHYFDCAECAVDIKALATFADNAREVLRQEKANQLAVAPVLARPVWLRWLQPVVAVPAFAALLLIIAYQNVVTIPQARNTSSRAVAEVYGQSFSLQPSDTRGGNETAVNKVPLEVRPNEGFLLQLDFIPSASFPAYLGQLRDASGRVLQQLTVPAEKAKKELHLPVPAGLISRPGQYSLVFLGADPVSGKPVNDSKLQYFTFNVAFRN